MKTFSDSWHRVANLTVILHPSVEVHKQRFRGEDWYVLSDPFNNRFFRIRPPAYQFLARLTPGRSVEETWRMCLALFPEEAPGQEEVVQILTGLHVAELLHFTNTPDSEGIFERGRRRRSQERRALWLSVLFFKVPLFDPDPLLDRLRPLLKVLVGPVGALAWLTVVALGLKAVVGDAASLLDPAEGLLAPTNLPLLYGALVVVKVIHESGHAVLCKHFGGEVRTVGLMFAVLTPLPYVDASSSWQFTSRGARALVGAGGMLAEIAVASLAAVVWVNTGDGFVRGLAYNVMVTASVSTLAFNLNPLLRFDGYYILSDLLDIPNLYQRSRQHVYSLVERHAFGSRQSQSPAGSAAEGRWLVGYGVLSMAYRLLIFAAIIMIVADQFLALGIAMALVGLVGMGLVPAARFVSHLAGSPTLAGCRRRAVLVSLATAAIAVLVVAVLPFPRGVQATGVVESEAFAQVTTGVAGRLEAIVTPGGQVVEKGGVLVRLTSPEIDIDIAEAAAQVDEVKAAIDRARNDAIADLEPMARKLAVVQGKLDDLRGQREALTVTARQAGLWVAPDLENMIGTWIGRGQSLGLLVSPTAFRFSAVVTQELAADLFDDHVRQGVVRLRGQADRDLAVAGIEIIPFEQRKLPSARLGWQGGGDIAVALNDAEGRTSREPFFKVLARLPPDPAVTLMHGLSGILRLPLASAPLLVQASHGLAQLLQKRYRL